MNELDKNKNIIQIYIYFSQKYRYFYDQASNLYLHGILVT